MDNPNRFKDILAALSEGIMTVDAAGMIREVNDAALAIFGIERDEMVGKRYDDLGFRLIDATGSAVESQDMIISLVLRTGSPRKNAIRGFRKPDGTITWFKASASPLFGTANRIEEVVMVMTDVTELYTLRNKSERILETAREGFWEVQLDGTIVEANKAVCDLLGYEPHELIGRKTPDLTNEEGRGQIQKAHERRRRGIADSYEISLKTKGGVDVYVIISGSPKMDSSGKIDGSYVFITDVSDLKSTHDMLHTITAFSGVVSRALTETEVYGIFKHYLLLLRRGEARIDALYLVRIGSDGHSAEEVIHHHGAGIQADTGFPPLDRCKSYVYSGSLLVNDLSREYGCPFQRFGAQTGSLYCTTINIGGSVDGILHLYSASPHFFTGDIKGIIDSFISLFVPMINNMRLLELNKKLALTDSLTGLYNRRYFEVFMEKQLAITRRNNLGLSVVMLDLDNFKDLNDTHGHDAGDMVLRDIAKIVNECIRTADIAVRYGGEEFMVILPNTDKMAALDVAERLRLSIETTPVTLAPGKEASITASLGVATYGADAENLDTLLLQVDTSLYTAKKSGRNRTCVA
ncbi:MAG TPA: sensor domain-containing diguanylate cyclase [Dissulfurispiraceae bacterium]|nr:sensor domain-containing diguanylate cyclase [Dissulfurispiraceae bacterium]